MVPSWGHGVTGMKNWGIKGISSVEFAIVLPLILLVVFGMIQFAIGWWLSQVITNAAREGARFGIVVSDPPIRDSEVIVRVQNYLNSSGVDASQATVSVTYANGGAPVDFANCDSGCQVGVLVSVPVTNLIPVLFPMFPNNLQAQAIMRHE